MLAVMLNVKVQLLHVVKCFLFQSVLWLFLHFLQQSETLNYSSRYCLWGMSYRTNQRNMLPQAKTHKIRCTCDRWIDSKTADAVTPVTCCKVVVFYRSGIDICTY